MVVDTKEIKRQEYLKNKDKYIERAKKWAKNNPEKRKAIVDKYNRKSRVSKRKWHQIKSFGFEIKLDECSMCNSTEQLVVHHIDGNNGKLGKPLNNNFDNLVVLCRICHPKVHNRWHGATEIIV